jgi:hypothetical protein
MKYISLIIIFQILLFPADIKEKNTMNTVQNDIEKDGEKEEKIVTLQDLRNRVYRINLCPKEFKDNRNHPKTAEGEKGKSDALNDFKNGVYRLEIYGYHRNEPRRLVAYYRRLLLKKYNIRIERVAGCSVNNGIVSHAREYNKVMINELKKKFGENVFFDTKMQAIKLYNDKTSKK